MPNDFLQYLVLFLIILLFAKELLPAILSKWGFKMNGYKNGKHHSQVEERERKQDIDQVWVAINELRTHAQVANGEMGYIKESMQRLEKNVNRIWDKLNS